MTTAGLLLTGGSSRRFGRDKAAVLAGDDETWAGRTGRLIAAVCCPALEIGPGRSHLRAVPDQQPGEGPLAAVATGVSALDALGWAGPVLVVATDLPLITPQLLSWLANHPSGQSVVPLRGGRLQPLCARYRREDLLRSVALVAEGRRAMRDLLAAIDVEAVGPEVWGPAAGDLHALVDVDVPGDLDRLALRASSSPFGSL